MANNKVYNRSEFTTSSGAVDSDSLKKAIINSAITIAFDEINTTATEVNISFKAELAGANETLLDDLVADHPGVATVQVLPKFDELGNQYITSDSRTGTKLTFISHNWCDKTTWYPDSARVSNVTMDTTGDPRVFDLPEDSLAAGQVLIDCGHCKFSDEIDWTADYAVEVKDDGDIVQEKTADFPDFASGGKYAVDYQTGQVTFDPSYTVTGPVTISYSKSQTSKWEIHPPFPGTMLRLEGGKVQFYKDVNITDTIVFEIYGIKGVDPRAAYVPGNPGDVVLVGSKYYRDLFSLVEESSSSNTFEKNTPITPTARDLDTDIRRVHWSYAAAIDLRYSYGNFIRVRLLNNNAMVGARASATVLAILRME